MMKSMNSKTFLLITILLAVVLAGISLTSCSSSSDSGGSAPVVSPTATVYPSSTPTPSPTASPYPDPQPTLPKKKVTIGSTVITAEIADDDKERENGLSWRRSLGDDEGMLFVYPFEENAGIWMYGMLFNLDVIWFRGVEVIYIHEDVPAPSNPYNTNIPTYSPGEPINYFLEVNSGFVKKNEIKVGDKIKIEDLK